ncbi:MAG: hypothetical protein GY816_07030 [Cytophagales bacterium]|nr:hypothetical protein [Cytophagales bacterium]
MEDLAVSDYWQEIVLRIGLGGWILCAFILLWYSLIATAKRGSTAKYAFVAKYELPHFQLTALIFAISSGLLFFAFLGMQFVKPTNILFYFAGFVSLGIAFMLGYALSQYLKVYYPFFLEKKLRNIRFKTHKSPKTGKLLKLLREHEEDVHMTEEMIAEEKEFTFDYDVWLDEETGYKIIEKYEGHLHAQICPKCEFRTMKDYHEKVMREATNEDNGRLRKYYRCSYCGHEEMQDVDIASNKEEHEMIQDAELA